MKGVAIVRETVAASVAVASVAFLAGFVLNQRSVGLGIALGLVVGAGNGELIQRVIESRTPFVVSSILRMAGLSAAAIAVAFIIGASPIYLLIGVALAQFVMVAVAVRQGLRA